MKAHLKKEILKLKDESLGSEEIWNYTEELINENVKKGNILVE